MSEEFVGKYCKCPKCGSKNIWVRKDFSRIRCDDCGNEEEKKWTESE